VAIARQLIARGIMAVVTDRSEGPLPMDAWNTWARCFEGVRHIYRRFTEGFGSTDLVTAKTFLESRP